MRLFHRKPHLQHILPVRIEILIRDGIFRWMENREYRNPDDCIEHFAESIGVTQSEVADYLRFHLDIKYCTLRRLLRIRDAAVLLLVRPKEPLRHIGRLVGYTDPSNFRHQFREYTNYSPDDWRKHFIGSPEHRRMAV
jgi:AraC-like DNA-binding protein